MNAYEIRTAISVKHNDIFICNNFQKYIVHARSEKEARQKLKLAPSKITNLTNLKVEASDEVINYVYSLGTVTIEPYYVYSGDNAPISVEEFKRRQHG